MPFFACKKEKQSPDLPHRQQEITATTYQDKVPVLTKMEDNTLLNIKLHPNSLSSFTISNVKITLDGTTDIRDIESLRLIYTGTDASKPNANLQFGETMEPASEITFTDQLEVKNKAAFFRLSVKLRDEANLLHRIDASCESVTVNDSAVTPDIKSPEGALRLGTALRKPGDDGVNTYRIPGLATTANGTLLAIYDVRRDKSRDLQGNIDIGLSRSTDGGQSWEPMQIVLDQGAWGGLPEKFNGVSDACVLVDQNTNTIFVAGLWMHGVINSGGQWVEGLTEASEDWNHQWKNRGSQPGFGVKETSQFLITKSTDDGQTWARATNLTEMCKKESWWLWAPAPGQGITLEDGTLVFPTQGRDSQGKSFSNITWSRDGSTWTTSNMASHGTTENMVVQLSDGTLMLNARDGKNKGNTSGTNGRVISVTADLGETWSEHPTSRGALIEPACMASIHKHEYFEGGEKKSILLFSNPNSRTARDHMTIKVSFDDGQTWPEAYWLLLDKGKGRGYSCLTSVDEETIGILYEGSKADMVFQKIALSDLIGK
ncbi:sialidase [Sinomicrobium soli]|nr:sialidase [Sinomicrobium sp. N-1-3-6]